jgi:DNA primase
MTDVNIEDLEGELFKNLDSINPSMNWKWKGQGWRSPYKIDGSSSKTLRDDKCVCTVRSSGRYSILEQGEEGKPKGLFDHVCEVNGFNGDFLNKVKECYSLVGIDFSSTIKSTISFKIFCDKIREQYKSASISSDIKKYLTSRGWSNEEIAKAPFGYIPSKKWVENLLKNDFKTFCDKYGLNSNKFDLYKLIFIWCNPQGYPERITMRDITGANNPKILNTTGSTWTNPYLIETVKFSDGEDIISTLVVEGEIDATRCYVNGINAVATGGVTRIKESMLIDSLVKLNVDKVIFIGDGDEPGKKSCFSFAKEAVNYNLNSYITKCPDKHKDLDDIFRNTEKEELYKDLINSKLKSGSYIAKAIFKESLSDERDALVKARKILESFNPKYIEHQKDFAKEAETLTGLDIEALNATIKQRERKEKEVIKLEKEKKKTDLTLKEIHSYLQKVALGTINNETCGREITRLCKSLNNAVSELTAWNYEDILALEANKPEPITTGYKTFDENKVFFHPSAITIIAGRTHHGKTTFIINLLKNQLKIGKYRWLYLAWEYDVAYFLNKLKTCCLNEEALIKECINNELLILPKPESSRDIDKIVGTINYYADKYKDEDIQLGGVFIDYIQQIRSLEGTKNSAAYLDLKRISEEMIDVAKRNKLAIVNVAQLNREASKSTKIEDGIALHNIREAGDLEQIAHTVIGIYSTNQAKKESYTLNKKHPEGRLMYKVLKNRDGGGSDWISDLSFNGENAIVSETLKLTSQTINNCKLENSPTIQDKSKVKKPASWNNEFRGKGNLARTTLS